MPNRYKSKWEMAVAAQLQANGHKVQYEQDKFKYTIPESIHTYTPDFRIKKGKVYVEAKGKFTADDRKKHLLLKQQYPNIRFVIVFQNANQRLRKGSNTTYADWCTRNNIEWTHKQIPKM